MNYPKLFLSVLLLTGLTANYGFGMQKPGSDSDFQNQAFSWISENKKALFYGTCALIAGYGLYKYWSTPRTPEQIKAKIKKETVKYIQNLANNYAGKSSEISDFTSKNGTYTLTITEQRNTQGKIIGMKANYLFACDNTTETIFVPVSKNA